MVKYKNSFARLRNALDQCESVPLRKISVGDLLAILDAREYRITARFGDDNDTHAERLERIARDASDTK